jgi:DNA repair protein RadC
MTLDRMIGDFEVPVYHTELVRDYSIPFQKIGKTEDNARVLHTMLDSSPVEQFVALYVNAASEIIGAEKIAIGDLDRVNVGMRNLFRGAIVAGAYAVVVGHNHPSGNCTPSDEDLTLTGLIISAASYIGITLMDHVIVSPRGNHFSILDNEQEMLIRLMEMKMKKVLSPGEKVFSAKF